jgi:hypothetical protein
MTLSIGHAFFNQSGTRNLPYSSLPKSLLLDRESARYVLDEERGSLPKQIFFSLV